MRFTKTIFILFFGLSVSQGQVVPSLVIPASNEPTIVFSNEGKTYLVGQKTGKVAVLDTAPVIVPPLPVDPEIRPNTVNLTGLAKVIYDSMVSAVPAANLKPGAQAMTNALTATLAQVGGLGLKGQKIVEAFATQTKLFEVQKYFAGWTLGDLLQAQGVDTDEKLISALAEAQKAMGAVR